MLSTSVVSFKMADSSSDSDDVGEKSLQKGEKRRQEESDEDSDEDSSSEVNTDGSDESFDENVVRADHSYFADVFLTKFFLARANSRLSRRRRLASLPIEACAYNKKMQVILVSFHGIPLGSVVEL